MLSHPLPIVALVSRYLTNKLIGRGPLPRRNRTLWSGDVIRYYRQFPAAIPVPGAGNPRVTLPFAAFPGSENQTGYPHDLHA